MTPTFASLKEALQQAFSPEMIQFLPKDIKQEKGQCTCRAFPYANKRVYEDRLNELVFGEWSSPYAPPYAQGNKLIIPATVVILGIAHTDYGEEFFARTGKNGTTREEENTATEAYSQAFRRACAKFLLGRYLYDLPHLRLPYDQVTRQIAISTAERVAWVEKLYLERGLLPKTFPRAATSPVSGSVQSVLSEPVTSSSERMSTKVQNMVHPTTYPHDTFLDWVCRCVKRDSQRIAGICTYYQVQDLTHLSSEQRQRLTQQLQKQVSVSAPSLQTTP